MTRPEPEGDDIALSAEQGDYIAHERTRHGIRSRTRRLFFFALTASWGFLVGLTGFLASLGLAQVPVHVTSEVFLGLGVSLLVALGGGWVFASAYEESKRRK